MKPGACFRVHDGTISIPEGGYVCLWALQSLIPVLTMKEREIAENKDVDWVWRVHHVQCPDPDGRVVWRIVREGDDTEVPPFTPSPIAEATGPQILPDLKVTVDKVQGKCTSGMSPGDHFILRSGRIYLPPGKAFCLYAMQAALPMLPAKQRAHSQGDWMLNAPSVICPDPAGNVYLRIDKLEE